MKDAASDSVNDFKVKGFSVVYLLNIFLTTITNFRRRSLSITKTTSCPYQILFLNGPYELMNVEINSYANEKISL